MDRYLLELDPGTMHRLYRLKSHPEEPYDRIINRLIDSCGDADRLTKEEVGEIREALRRLKEGGFMTLEPVKEGGFMTPEPVKEESAPGPEIPPAGIGDPQAVKDMEEIFSGTAEKPRDPEPAEPEANETHEIEPVKEESAPGPEIPPASIGDPQAVKDMEEIFSGTAEKPREPEPAEPDSDEIHEIGPPDKKKRSPSSDLDNL